MLHGDAISRIQNESLLLVVVCIWSLPLPLSIPCGRGAEGADCCWLRSDSSGVATGAAPSTALHSSLTPCCLAPTTALACTALPCPPSAAASASASAHSRSAKAKTGQPGTPTCSIKNTLT
jgi:hypothetical protein